ncbi:hypothetical protein VTK73DRAFT_1176 [Phialemonium thermophilum]|uniref:Uncharacterized protein n=1 Tax=Phialemonium thermophilum TaxID=223376 RepID=A0ABR3XBS8_9PEZI
MVKSPRKKAGKVLKRLKALQKDNVAVTPYQLNEAKFLLCTSSRCATVQIQFELNTEYNIVMPFERMPTFISSQLEAQKLTHANYPDSSLWPALYFIVCSLPFNFTDQDSYPVLFRWHCQPRHRTYIFFAFVDLRMPARSYSIEELLRMRVLATEGSLACLNNYKPELDVVRTNTRNGTGNRTSSSDQTGESRASTMNHHGQWSSSSEGVVDHEAPVPVQPYAVAHARNHHDQASTATVPSSRAHTSDLEWKYRGRGNSDAASTEPLRAPPGLPAQKREGFQRFYKAVASPTHVRVTAGGRIVPNTRGPASPTTKRRVGSVSTAGGGIPIHAESGNQSERRSNTNPTLSFVDLPPQQSLPAGIPFFHPFAPGFPNGFPAYPAFMPLAFSPNLPGGYPFQAALGTGIGPAMGPTMAAPVNAPMIPQPVTEGVLKNPPPAFQAGDGQTDKVVEMDKNDKSHLPRPENFDPSKSLLYNGQWMLPMPSAFAAPLGSSFLPGPMLAATTILGHPSMTPQFNQQHLSVPVQAISGTLSGAGPGPVMHSSAAVMSGQANGTNGPPMAPPVSSIRPSEITKKQLASFRTSLRYHEDQLQYNRHQIDEKAMEAKVKSIKENIQHFESVLQSQLEHEKLHYPREKGDEVEHKEEPVAAESRTESAPSHNDDPAAHPGRKDHRPVQTSIDNIAAKAPQDAFPAAGCTAVSVDPVKRSGFSNEAALAPPFLPSGDVQTRHEMNLSQTSENHICQKDPQHGGTNGIVSITSAHHSQVANGFPTLQTQTDSAVAGSAFGTDSQYDGFAPRNPYLGVPYLVGTLPKGIDPQTAKDTDFQYPRQLTEEEIRARHLYWGRAPSHVRLGLPKYDGKNFYSPSPLKKQFTDISTEADETSDFVNQLPTGVPEVDYNLRPEVNLSQSEATASGRGKTKALSADEGHQTARKSHRFRSQGHSVSEDSLEVVEEVDERDKSFNPKKDDADPFAKFKSADCQDKKIDKSGGTRLWRAMLRKVRTSSAVSSTIAKGYLPPYAGSATKLLGPSSSKGKTISVEDTNPHKRDGNLGTEDEETLVSPEPEKTGENRRQHGEGSLEEQFRNMVSLDTVRRSSGNYSPTLNV